MKRMGAAVLFLACLFFAQAADAAWTPAKRITKNLGQSYVPTIAADSLGHLHVVWDDGTPGHYEIYYKKSTDGGTTWKPAVRLTRTSDSSFAPVIVVDGRDALHVVWHEYGGCIYYMCSSDEGATWSTAKIINTTNDIAEYPDIGVDSSGRLHVVWQGYTYLSAEQIYYGSSPDNGVSWATSQKLTSTAGKSYFPALAVTPGGSLFVVWQDDTLGNFEIYFKRSLDGGGSWKPGKRITATSGDSEYPDIAFVGSVLHVVWDDNSSGKYEIYYKKSSNRGATWTATKRLTKTAGDSVYPAIAVDGLGHLHVVWYDQTPGNNEIYYMKSTNAGTTWTMPQRLTSSKGDSRCPNIGVDLWNNLHVVWHDSNPGNYEIFYKKGK
jgi:hypothetical protein